jgi:hypothetical protein
VISRRSFLIGAAAAATVTRLTLLDEPAWKAITDPRTVWRRINEVYIYALNPDPVIRALRVEVRRDGGQPLLQQVINPLGTFRWKAMLDSEIVMPPEQTLKIVCTPMVSRVHVDISSQIAGGPSFLESYELGELGQLYVDEPIPFEALPQDADINPLGLCDDALPWLGDRR